MGILTVYEDYYKYFRYKGETYTAKTKVKISQKYIDSHLYDGKRIWKYAYFSNGIMKDNKKYCVFWAYNFENFQNSSAHCPYFYIDDRDLEFAIDEIISPISINVIKRTKKKDVDVPEVSIGWIVYFLALIFSFAFVEWYLIWFWGTIYFFLWRNKKLWK